MRSLKSYIPKFSALHADNQQATCQTGVFNCWTETHEKDYGIFMQNKRAHYVLASFVFSTPSDLSKVSFIAGKAASYVKKEAFVQFMS